MSLLGAGVRVLLLHDVPADRMGALGTLLDLLSRLGTFASTRDLSGDAWLARDFLVTFDDGFESAVRATDTVLEPRGIACVHFVCPAFVESGDEAENLFRQKVRPGAPRLPVECRPAGWESLASLHAKGHVIASHTMTHARLTGIRDDELVAELEQARDRIEDRIGATVPWMAYPFGDIDSIDAHALEVIRRSHTRCFTGIRGSNRISRNPFLLYRQSITMRRPLLLAVLASLGAFDPKYRGDRARLLEMCEEVGLPTAG